MGSRECCGLGLTKILLHIFQFVFLVGPDITTADAARVAIFGTVRMLEFLPPTTDALRQHILRCHFQVTGIAICAFGAWNFLETYHFINVLGTSAYSTTIYVFLATGVLVILVFFVGCCAIPKRRTKLLFCYILLLVSIFLLEALVGVLSYIYRENIEEEMNLNFNTTLITTYKYIDDKTESIDYIQQKLECCGAANFLDWRGSTWIQDEAIANKVPDSCCKSFLYECGRRDHPSNIFYRGCMDLMTNEIKLSLWLICAVALGLSVVQVFGIIFGIVLFLKLESGKYDAKFSPTNGNENLLPRDDEVFH